MILSVLIIVSTTTCGSIVTEETSESSSKSAKDPEASQDSEGTTNTDNLVEGDDSEAEDEDAASSDTDEDSVVPAESGKADEGAPGDLIDRLQNLGDAEDAEEEIADDGGSRGIPGAAGIAIFSSSNRAAAGVWGLLACVLGSIVFVL